MLILSKITPRLLFVNIVKVQVGRMPIVPRFYGMVLSFLLNVRNVKIISDENLFVKCKVLEIVTWNYRK